MYGSSIRCFDTTNSYCHFNHPPPLGDYDALLVLMLLPRLTFKADMLKDQLRQQHKLDEALGSLSTLTPQQADQLTFVLALVYKLSTLQLLVARATR